MRVLVACEFSDTVASAFRRRGHTAFSCDLLPTEGDSAWHHQGDVRQVLSRNFQAWDLLIFHAPCTYLCNSGVRWLYGGKGKVRDPVRWYEMERGAKFYRELLHADVPRIAGENPIMHSYAREIIGRGFDQIIQPWMFGHGETKATGLHLINLPPLEPTKIVEGRTPRVHFASPGKDRWKERSRTYSGIADAMADQWGAL